MNLKVLAEAGPTVGLGHFTRSLALVQMVNSIVTPVFYGLDESLVINALDAQKISFQKLSSVGDFVNHISKEDIVLMDGYGYDGDFQKAIKEKCHKLFLIDDKHDKTYHADFIINPAPGIKGQDYQIVGGCNFLLGPEYALLRPAFLKSPKRVQSEKPTKAVVCFGGADPDNLSHAVVEVLLSFQQLTSVHLIIGPAYSFDSSLKDLMMDSRLKISKRLAEQQMADALSEADFAIVPSSGILYECLGVGTPAISGYYVDNQIFTYQGWLKNKAIIGVDNFEVPLLKRQLSKLLNGEIDLNEFAKNSPVDGKSPQRFLEIFNEMIANYEL